MEYKRKLREEFDSVVQCIAHNKVIALVNFKFDLYQIHAVCIDLTKID